METVGSMLRQARERQGISLSDVEKATKIRQRFLIAIEHDDYGAIPSQLYAKGFVKNYSEFLGLQSATILAFFRRQTQDVTKQSLLPKKSIDDEQKTLFQLTPGKFLGILLGILLLLFFSYFVLQYTHLQQAPALSIEKPEASAIFEETKTEIIGKTDPDATVTVNGMSVLVRSDGKFFDQVSLTPGVNTITVVSTSRFGKTTTLTRSVGLKQ